MKELSIEEKAKRYDEAIKIAKDSLTYPDYPGFIRADVVFPELKESEDENIRKWIIDDIRYNMNNEPLNNSEYKKKAEKAIAWLEKQEEQNPAWSKEDEQNYDALLKIICSSNKSENSVNELFSWFKSLKDRVSPKQDWSEEDKKMWLQIINEFESIKFYSSTIFEKNIAQDKIDFLKSFKDKVFPQPKQEWSKHDETLLNCCLGAINTTDYFDKDNKDEMKNWLKERVQPQNLTVTDEELKQAKKDAYNDALDKIEYYSSEPTFGDGWDAAIWYLKKRNIISTWKPSDKQLEVMSYLAKYYAMGIDEPNRSIIISLYEDLQKLRKK